MTLNPELVARNGRVLRVIVVCRISTEHQDERSLQDQEALYRSWLSKHWDGAVEVEVLASQGSGESLVRDDYFRLIALVESRKFDLVISEDLGRICRRVHAHLFCELCQDASTRCIALNDHVDTALDNWTLSSFFAVMRHETYNADTSQRIRRSKRNRFINGGPWQCPIYGYIKPVGATSIDDIQKDPAAEPIVERIFAMLEDGASFAEVSDWLNSESVSTGPYCRSEKWTGTILSQFVRNPVLKGIRHWNERTTVRRNSTGLRRSVKATPDQLLIAEVPHLAFIDAERFDRVMRMLKKRNKNYQRKKVDGVDPREGVPRQRTTWPSQHMQCGVCGATFIFGGHGRAGHIFCRGVPAYTCWNCPSVDVVNAGTRIVQRILSEIEQLPDFDSEFASLIHEEAGQNDLGRQQKLAQVQTRLERIDREEDNVTTTIRGAGFIPALTRDLQCLQAERDELLHDRDQLEAESSALTQLPSMAEIRELARAAVADLLPASPEFGRQIRGIVTKLIAVPYQMIGGGQIVLRAFVEIDLAGFAGLPSLSESAPQQFVRRFIVDLFDPPQREEYRSRVIELQRQKKTFKKIGPLLGITDTAAQNAAALQRAMDEASVSDPYKRVVSPEECSRIRRHRHQRFQFETIPGFEATPSMSDWLAGIR